MKSQRLPRQTRLEGKEEQLVSRDGDSRAVADLWKPDYAGQAKTLARMLVEDPIYLHNLRIAMQTRTVAPAVENMIWERAFGKVKEEIEVRKIEAIRIVHEYLPEDSQRTALTVLPGEIVEAKILGANTEQSPDSRGAGQGDGHHPEVESPPGEGHEVQGAVSGSGRVDPVGQDDGCDLETD
jgi:hypothetical protein